MSKRKSDEEINYHSDIMVKVTTDFTKLENAEHAIGEAVKENLEIYLPRMLPGRGEMIETAAASSIAQFRAGVKWAIKHPQKLDT